VLRFHAALPSPCGDACRPHSRSETVKTPLESLPKGAGSWVQPYVKHLRWYICALLFFAAAINYLDRQTVAALKEDLSTRLGWSEAGYGWINFSFQLSYAFMMSFAGRLVDLLGVRLCFAVAVVVWSSAAMGHALCRSVFQFCIARFFLGAGEAANWPASVKAVAEWFPKKERALATGIFNGASNFGVMFAAAAVWIAHTFGWQMAFAFTGGLGFVWFAVWLKYYHAPRKHPALSPEELALIEGDHESAVAEEEAIKIPWVFLLRYRQGWAFFVAKFMTDPVWWFYLYWLPSYLVKERGFSTMASISVLMVPYFSADLGSIGAGWLASFWMNRGWRPARARLTVMFIAAMCMPTAIWAVLTNHVWVSLALISLATAGHEGWSTNLFTTPSDLFPKRVVGSVVGLGGACGAIGGMLMTLLAGGFLQWFGSYVPLFVTAGLMHPLALVLFVAFAGKDMAPANVEEGLHAGPSLHLIVAGGVIALSGSIAALFAYTHWHEIIIAAKNSTATAAGMFVASSGVILVGLLLVYAGLGRRGSLSQAR
jgi:ACS family hexuronate transporter-like MFS transporter